MNLVIVESPTKARTLSKFLGSDYRIEATMGHVRDLPKKKLGVEIKSKEAKKQRSKEQRAENIERRTDNIEQVGENEAVNYYEFIPDYQVIPERKKRVAELKKIASDSKSVILATDPDREGEAIAYHTAVLLTNGANKPRKVKSDLQPENTRMGKDTQRIVFHEITDSAIKEALLHPRGIDMQLVDAQQARRVLDRLVGYKLSPLLWNKLGKRWLSAGRVQSVAVRLIVEREKEIEKFIKEEFWRIFAVFKTEDSQLEAELVSKDGQAFWREISFELFDGKYTVSETTIATEFEAKTIIDNLQAPYVVSSVEKKEVKRIPPPPFTTSKLQQEAGRSLYFSSKKTMSLAQKLYEEGYITYHRTDSFNLSEKFLAQARDFIEKEYGKNYHAGFYRRYTTKSKVAQEAHEAIRPTDVEVRSEKLEVGNDLNRDHVRLYELIWKRAVASQAADAIFDSTTIKITSNNGYLFEAKGSVIKFDGYLKIAGRLAEDKIIPNVSEGQTLSLLETRKTQNWTTPPPRYTEASLIRVLEEKDIGRPSTYAPIISTIQDRQYVEKMVDEDGKRSNKFAPTELGVSVTDFLVANFSSIVELLFTAKMEDSLDDIANGEKKWMPVLSEFYGPFFDTLDSVYKNVEKVKEVAEEVGENCPNCGNPLVYRLSKYGKFIACSTYPECKFTKNIIKSVGIPCPRCGGEIIVKRTKRGKQFYGCSNYPKCTFAAWKKEEIK